MKIILNGGLSLKECKHFANELRDFSQAKSISAFHQYLDIDALDDVEVKVSIGEYTVEFFTRNGESMWKEKS